MMLFFFSCSVTVDIYMFAVCFCRNAIVGLSVFLSVDSFGSLQIGSAVSFSLDTPGAQKDLHVAFFYHVTTW